MALAMMPLPDDLLRLLDEPDLALDLVDLVEDADAPRDFALEVVDLEVLRDDPAFEELAFDELAFEELAFDEPDFDELALDELAFFAEGLLEAAFEEDEALDFAPDVFDFAAPELFDEPDLLADDFAPLLDPEDRDEVDFELEDFLVVAMIVSPLIKRIQNEQSPLCKAHTTRGRCLLVICITVFV